jgi:uncharacterized protein (TIGR03437 family)
VSRLWPVLVVVVCAIARGAAPSYSAAGILSSASALPAYAPNALVTIYGTDLADAARGVTPSDISNDSLPTMLVTTRVYVNSVAAPLLYVSDRQVNFLLPPGLVTKALVRVVRNSLSGPEIPLDLAAAAPALFVSPEGYALVTHADGALVESGKPAAPSELVVIYTAGLGKYLTPTTGNEIPRWASEIVDRASLRVTFNGVAVDPARIAYAGVTPLCAGVYQINLYLPENLPVDPELRLFVGDAASQAGLKLPLRLPAAQLYGAAGR